MKKFFNEFKTFAFKGNVMNLAVGIIIGAAFQGIVSSLTENILAPIIGLFVSTNFDGLQVTFLGVTLKYGAFITTVINFLIMAFIVFLIVKWMNKITDRSSETKEAPVVPKCPFCLTEIDPAATRCPACTSTLEAIV